MSYILDALKKLEQEKTRKSRTAGKINISGELFGGESSRPVQGRSIKTVLLVAAAVLIIFAITWFLLIRQGGYARTSNPNSAAKLPAANSAPPVPAVPPVTTPSAPSAPAVPPVPPVQAPIAITTAPAAAVTSSVPIPAASPAVPSEDDEDEREQRRSRRSLSSKIPSSPMLKSPALTSVQAPADIKVSGIAWQDERGARRAVVNGFLMREGAVVSGAKITEILQDRVRFSLSGTSFEVTLLSAGLPSSGK